MLDLVREIAQTLRNNRLRTALTGLAVAWGIFMLIVLLGAARGVVNSFTANMGSERTNVITFWGGMTSMPYKGYKEGRRIQLRSADLAPVEKADVRVDEAVATASLDSTVRTSRDYVSGLTAVYPRAQQQQNIRLVAGRFINQRDVAEHRRAIVIRDKDAAVLFADSAKAVGSTVKALGLAWTVVGVYTDPWRSGSYIPYPTFKSLTGNNDEAWQIDATLRDVSTEDDADAAEKNIRAALAEQHQFNADDRGAVWTWNRFKNYLQQQQGFFYLNLAVWIIGIFTLLSGIVGVSNIMFVSVRERTHEIGIRRAIGAKPRAILTQIIAESVAITTMFGYIGVFFGMVVLQIIDLFVGDSEGFKNPTVDISIAVQVTVALVIAGALAGLFPAMKAVKVKPVEALRDE